MNYRWNIMISWLLLQFLVPVQSYKTEATIPVSSPIKLACDEDLRVNNIEVAIRRSNTSCWTTPEECTVPIQTIDSIKDKCNKQESCEVDIRNTTDVNHCLNEYGFFNVWYTCKKILDFSCDFESDLCNWSLEHNETRFRWEHGNRLDYYYKPPVDHTSASTTGKYVYIYDGGSTNGDVANLESGRIIAMNQQCLSFWFFTTNSRDSVYVYQNDKLLYDLSNYEKEKWHHIQTSLEKSDNSYKFVFKVIRRNRRTIYFGAIVIDDILIENQHCNSSIFQCDFDTSSCYWNSQYQHHYEWVHQHGNLWLFYPGPRYDHSTASDDGYYLYLITESDVLTAEVTTVYLELPNVDMKILVNSCFTFWYYMHGEGIGGINVTLDDEFAWTKFGNQDDKWNKGMIDLHKRKLSNIKFIGIVANGWIGDIAIDDLYITDGTCEGLFDHEEICVHLEEGVSKETVCPKGYLDFTNQRLSFDPEKMECSNIYNQTKMRILQECEYRDNSQKCLLDLSSDTSSHPECFQATEFRILHTCEGLSLDCNFERGKCYWSTDSDTPYYWEILAGSTLSVGTGPDNDHTTGLADGHYMYLEGTNVEEGIKSKLTSKTISPYGDICFSFWYHMYGENIGILNVYTEAGNITTRQWSRYGNQGNVWKFANFTISKSEPFRIIFEGTSGDDYKSDIALDDIVLLERSCSANDTTVTTVSSVITSREGYSSDDITVYAVVVSTLVIILVAASVFTVIVCNYKKRAKSSKLFNIRQNTTVTERIDSLDYNIINYNKMTGISVLEMKKNRHEINTKHRQPQDITTSIEQEDNNCNKYESLSTNRNSVEHTYESDSIHTNQYESLTKQRELDKHNYESTEHALPQDIKTSIEQKDNICNKYESLSTNRNSVEHTYESDAIHTNQYESLTKRQELDEHTYESTEHALPVFMEQAVSQYQSLTTPPEADKHVYASTGSPQ